MNFAIASIFMMQLCNTYIFDVSKMKSKLHLGLMTLASLDFLEALSLAVKPSIKYGAKNEHDFYRVVSY